MIKSGQPKLKFELDFKLYIRLKIRIKNEKTGEWTRKYESTGIKLKRKSDWSSKGMGCVKSTEKEYQNINEALIEFVKSWKENSSKKDTEKKETDSPSFIEYFSKYNGRLKNYDTKVKHNSALAWVEKFKVHSNLADITFAHINREFVLDFKHYMETTKNQYKKISAQKTTDKYFQIFKKVCGEIEKSVLIEGKVFSFPSNTFKGIKLQETDKKQKERLELDEYERIKAFQRKSILSEFGHEKEIEKNIDKILLDRNKFILQIQFGGMRISDFLMLKWKNFYGHVERITEDKDYKVFNGKMTKQLAFQYIAFKTKLEMKVLVNDNSYDFFRPFLIAELERINYNQIKIDGLRQGVNKISMQTIILELASHPEFGNRLVFLSRESDNDFFKDYDATINNDGMRKRTQSIYAKINKNLKPISKWANLKFNLSTHIARHSNAQFLADNGFTAFEIMDSLGHRKLATAQQYVKRSDGIDVSDKINKRKIF